MKKIILTTLILVLTMVSVKAQTFGAKAGLNVANLAGDVTDNKALLGVTIGAFTEFELSDAIKLQPELLYSAQGAKYEEEGISIDFKMNYINIPVMFKFGVGDDFYLEAGPQIGFLVSAKVLGVDVKDEMESIDFGANLGLSYDITEELFAGARYNIGLSNVIKDSGDESVKNSVFSFSLGYRF